MNIGNKKCRTVLPRLLSLSTSQIEEIIDHFDQTVLGEIHKYVGIVCRVTFHDTGEKEDAICWPKPRNFPTPAPIKIKQARRVWEVLSVRLLR